MDNYQIYKLLIKIDEGYEVTFDEKKQLSTVREIKWNGINTLPKSMHMLKTLEKFDLSGSVLSDIYSLSELTSLKILDLSFTNISDISVLRELKNLTELYLSWNENLSDISSLLGLNALNTLDLSGGVIGNNISDISVLESLKNLSNLNLRSTSVSNLEHLSGLSSLTNLDLSNTSIKDISILSNLKNLTDLKLSYTKISDISQLQNLKFLQHLDLSWNSFLNNIEPLSDLIELKKLDISYTNIHDISVLSCLKSLKYLDLRGLSITAIPESILDLELDFLNDENPKGPGIYIHGLETDKQPIEIFTQSRELIRQYLENYDKVPLNECKVIFLGEAEAGKTYSIRRLLKKGAYLKDYDNESTLGIEISVSRTKFEESDIIVNYWDFGGQEIKRSMHRMFLTRRTVYVIFLNARQDPINESAIFWLENIKSYAPKAPVILIVNKIDQNKLPKLNDANLIENYGDQIKRIVRMSALKDKPDVFIDELQGSILEVVQKMPSVRELVPKSWKNLMDDIREIPEHYLTAETFTKKCIENKIEDYRKIQDNLIGLFHDIGISFCYYEDRLLSNYYILDPKWLVNAIYAFVSNSDIAAENGKISKNNLYTLLTENTLDGNPIKREYPDMKYEYSDIFYILGVTRKFFISYPIDNDFEFFPLLCDGDAKQSVKEAVIKDSLHFIFRYHFLPETVMHRLIVRMRDDIDYRYVWYSGGIFRQHDSKQTAYIYTISNELHIYVNNENSFYDPNEYMTPIMANVRRINEELGISADELVTYKKNGVEAELPFKYVRGNIENGIYWVYDPQINEAIDLRRVIKRYDSIQPKIRTELLKKILYALGDLQNKKIFYNADENARNEHVSSLLRAAGIPCCDQQTGGVSSTGIKPGERDIVIQDKNGQDILIYEGLNLECVQTTEIEDHLKRLINNYNPQGLSYGILVTYMKCKRDRYSSIIFKYENYITRNAPQDYFCNGKPEKIVNLGQYISCYEMSYRNGGSFFIIYHIIVRLGE